MPGCNGKEAKKQEIARKEKPPETVALHHIIPKLCECDPLCSKLNSPSFCQCSILDDIIRVLSSCKVSSGCVKDLDGL